MFICCLRVLTTCQYTSVRDKGGIAGRGVPRSGFGGCHPGAAELRSSQCSAWSSGTPAVALQSEYCLSYGIGPSMCMVTCGLLCVSRGRASVPWAIERPLLLTVSALVGQAFGASSLLSFGGPSAASTSPSGWLAYMKPKVLRTHCTVPATALARCSRCQATSSASTLLHCHGAEEPSSTTALPSTRHALSLLMCRQRLETHDLLPHACLAAGPCAGGPVRRQRPSARKRPWG